MRPGQTEGGVPVRWIWRALTRRLLLKFIALLCAVVLWVYADTFVVVERTMMTTISLVPPIEKPVKTYGFMAEESDGRTVPVQITVRGPSRRVREFTGRGNVYGSADSKRRFDMKHLLYGVWLTEADFDIPPGSGITIVDINPYVIQVREQMGEDPR